MDHQTRIDEIHPSAYPSQCVLDAGGLSSSAMLRDQEILKDRLPSYFPRPRSIRLLCDGGWRHDFKEHKVRIFAPVFAQYLGMRFDERLGLALTWFRWKVIGNAVIANQEAQRILIRMTIVAVGGQVDFVAVIQ